MNRLVILLISGPLLISACGSRTAVEPATPLVDDGTVVAPSTNPVSAITLSWFAKHSNEVNDRVQSAADAPTRDCMEAAGFTYSANAPSSAIGGEFDPTRLFGISDAAEAAEFGYSGSSEGAADLSGPGLETIGAPTDADGQGRWNLALL